MGSHLLYSLYGVAFSLLDDAEAIQQAFDQAIEACGATVLNKFTHKFTPQGVTIVYALSESHLSIHTFPEKQCCAIDFYTCGEMDNEKGMEVLIKFFQPIEIVSKKVFR